MALVPVPNDHDQLSAVPTLLGSARGGSLKRAACFHILVLLHVGLLAHADLLELLGAEHYVDMRSHDCYLSQ